MLCLRFEPTDPCRAPSTTKGGPATLAKWGDVKLSSLSSLQRAAESRLPGPGRTLRRHPLLYSERQNPARSSPGPASSCGHDRVLRKGLKSTQRQVFNNTFRVRKQGDECPQSSSEPGAPSVWNSSCLEGRLSQELAPHSQVGSQDHDTTKEVGTDPAGASNYGHDAAGRSCVKRAWKIKFFLLKLYVNM